MPQSKERHTEWMRERRVHKQGAQGEGAQPKGSQDWETISLRDIKSALPDDIVADIIAISEYDCIKERNITLEGRFRRAYKYHVWHDENFIDGIHKDSKYREFVTR